MNLNEQEKSIKDKMQGLEFEVDTQELWANLEAFVPQKRKKRPFLLIFAMIVVFSFSAYFLLDASKKEQAQTLTNIDVKNEYSVPASSKNESDLSNKSEIKTNQISERKHENKGLAAELFVEELMSMTEIETDNRQTKNGQKVVNGTQAEAVVRVDSKVQKAVNIPGLNTDLTVPNKDEDSNVNKAPISFSHDLKLNQQSTEKNSEDNLLISDRLVFNDNTIIKLGLNPLKYKFSPNMEIPSIELNSKISQKHRWSIQGGYYARLSNTSFDSENKLYRQYLDDFVQDKITQSMDLRIHYKLTNRLSAWTGILYQQDVLEFSVNEQRISRSETETISGIDIDSEGLETAVTGSLGTTVMTNQIAIKYQINTDVQAQVGLEYKVWNHSRFEMSILGGYLLNMASFVKGNYLTEELLVDKIDVNNPQITTKKIHPAYMAGMQVQYDLGPYWKLGIRSFYQQKITETRLKSTTYGSNQRSLSIGLVTSYTLH